MSQRRDTLIALLFGIALIPLLAGCSANRVRDAAARSQTMNNMKMIGLGLHNFHDTNGGLPLGGPGVAVEGQMRDPRKTHWRAAILPFIEQDNLYKVLFSKTEYWKDPMIAQTAIKDYQSLPLVADPTQTSFRVFVGNGAAFELDRSITFGSFTDGTDRTILMVEAEETVPWSLPEDFLYDPQKPLPKLGHPDRDQFLVLMADGSVRALSKKIDEKLLRALITRNGNEDIPLDWDRK